ncbi:MAG: PAS domain S-box protein [Actinobacteria bacterium]|nr:PAS domain S-box protein [Actinomycetota bacterium]
MGTSRPESGGQSATDLAPLVDALTALLPDGNPILVPWRDGAALPSSAVSAVPLDPVLLRTALAQLGDGDRTDVDTGFVHRLGTGEGTLAVLVVLDLPSDEARAEAEARCARAAPMLVLALSGLLHEDDLAQAREEAQSERTRLRATMDSLLDPHVYLQAMRDGEGRIVDFVYVDANDAACAYNRRTHEEMVGATLLEVLPGHEASGILAEYAQVVDSGEPILVDGMLYYNEILQVDRRSDVRGIRVGDGLSLTWRDVTERYDAADALAESEKRYRYLAEHASDVVYFAGLDRRVQWVAPSVTASLGWQVEELIGREVTAFLHPGDVAATNDSRNRAYAGWGPRPPDTAELGAVRVLGKDGSYRWFAVSLHPFTDDDGIATGVVGTMHDVNALVEARQTAQSERARLDATLDSLLDPHVFFEAVRDDADTIVDFRFTDVNQAACRYLRMPDSTLIGMRLTELLPDLVSKGIHSWFVRTVEVGEPLKVDDVPYTNDLLRADHWYDIRGNRVGDGLSFLWRDVTSRHAAAEELAASQERYRLLAENSSDVVYLTGPDGRIKWVAPSVARTLGWEPEELVGTEAVELAHPDDEVEIQARRSVAYSGAGVVPPEESQGLLLRLRTKAGPYVWVVSSNTPLFDDDGALVGVAGSMRDVDELVRAREEAQRERATLEATINSLLDPHVFLEAVRDTTGTVVDFVYGAANAAACDYMHMNREDLVGARLLDLLPGQAGTGMLDLYAEAVDTGRPLLLDDYAYPHEIIGDERRFDIRAIRVGDGLSFTWRDVTDRFNAARALAASEAKYRLLADNSSDVVAQLRDGVLEWVSSSVEAGLGWRPDELQGLQMLDFVHPDDHQRVLSGRILLEAGRSARRRYRFRAKDGAFHWLDSQETPLIREDGTLSGSVASMRIVDGEVRAQEALELRARQDHLTGLANREEAFERLDRILGRSRRTGEEIAVVFCDFDDFKRVNDTHGHAGGDELLRAVAKRIRGSVRSADLVARIGGDELLIVLDGVHDLDEAVRLTENLRQIVILPVQLVDGMVSTTMSIGVTIAGEGESLDDVVARADAAMYRAKSSGRDQVFAIPAM